MEGHKVDSVAQDQLREVVAQLVQIPDPTEKVAAYRALADFLESVAEDLRLLVQVELLLAQLEAAQEHQKPVSE